MVVLSGQNSSCSGRWRFLFLFTQSLDLAGHRSRRSKNLTNQTAGRSQGQADNAADGFLARRHLECKIEGNLLPLGDSRLDLDELVMLFCQGLELFAEGGD